MDLFESHYLLYDSVSTLMGSAFQFKKLLRAVLLDHGNIPPKFLFTAVFDDYIDKIKNKKVMLDHLLISHSLDEFVDKCGIAHDLWIRHSSSIYLWCKLIVAKRDSSRSEYLSDHRPVYVDFVITRDSSTPLADSVSLFEDDESCGDYDYSQSSVIIKDIPEEVNVKETKNANDADKAVTPSEVKDDKKEETE